MYVHENIDKHVNIIRIYLASPFTPPFCLFGQVPWLL